MLAKLLEGKMKSENWSLRSIAHKTGVSHTTISRLLKNEPVDLVTIQKVSAWLGISTSDVLKSQIDLGLDEDEVVISNLLMLFKSNPKLFGAFKEIIKEYQGKRLSQSDLDEILSFIIFKLRPPSR